MATRTSSPPGSRSKSTSARKKGQGGSASRTRSTGNKSGRKPAPKSGSARKRGSSTGRRPAPRAVRNGPGPIARVFTAFARVLASAWLGVAHAVGGEYAAIGHTARDLDPEHRRDGAGLFLVGLALVVAAAVWWQLPGDIGDFTRTVVAGSVGLLAWFVPLLLCFVAWRNLRDPERNGPPGRQVIGWGALLFGVLGIVHIANGSPTPELGDTAPLQQAGGAIGFVVSKLLMDLLQTAYVVVPLLLLLGALRGARRHGHARLPGARRGCGSSATASWAATSRPRTRPRPRTTTPVRRRRKPADDEIDPEMGDPAYDSPVLGGPRDRQAALAASRTLVDPDTEPTGPVDDGPRSPSRRRRTPRCPRAWSSSRCPATSPTRCPTARCSSRDRCTRPARRLLTTSSSG